MNKKSKSKSWFIAWVNGEHSVEPQARLSDPRSQRTQRRAAPSEEKMHAQLLHFLRRYHVAATAICAVLAAVLLVTVWTLPTFGAAGNPSNNEVAERYLARGLAETGSENAVTGMIFTYRGFDTLGESCVLFLAVSCVMMLLARDANNTTAAERAALARESHMHQAEGDLILRQMGSILIPCGLMYGLYVLFNGESSPGGGFSSGAILGTVLILYSVVYGGEALGRFLSRRVYGAIRVAGLTLYAVLFAVYIFCGANGLAADFTRHIVLPIDMAVGLVVTCTMYGFYALFGRGEI